MLLEELDFFQVEVRYLKFLHYSRQMAQTATQHFSFF